MAQTVDRGKTALERYRDHLREEPRCGECGHVDDGGDWSTRFRDGRLTYRHVCPRCGAIARREFRLR